MPQKKVDCLIVGGGLAGCALAVELHKHKKTFFILEQDPNLGGRIRSKNIKGFTLDQGFQVSLTSYPWVQEYLDQHTSDFYKFDSGARILHPDQSESLLANPLKHPRLLLKTLQSPIFAIRNIVPLIQINLVSPKSVEHLSTREFLDLLKFRSDLIEQFFRPFFGGIFLDGDLKTSAALFVYLYRLFACGQAFIPKLGMGQLIDWLTAKLPTESIKLNARAKEISAQSVTLDDGQTFHADFVVKAFNDKEDQSFNSTYTYWISIPKLNSTSKLITLNGDTTIPVLHSSIVSHVNPHYSPSGLDLVSVTGLSKVTESQLASWLSKAYEVSPKRFEVLEEQFIAKALPKYSPETSWLRQPFMGSDSLFELGDHTSFPSQQGVINGAQELCRVLLRTKK